MFIVHQLPCNPLHLLLCNKYEFPSSPLPLHSHSVFKGKLYEIELSEPLQVCWFWSPLNSWASQCSLYLIIIMAMEPTFSEAENGVGEQLLQLWLICGTCEWLRLLTWLYLSVISHFIKPTWLLSIYQSWETAWTPLGSLVSLRSQTSSFIPLWLVQLWCSWAVGLAWITLAAV